MNANLPSQSLKKGSIWACPNDTVEQAPMLPQKKHPMTRSCRMNWFYIRFLSSSIFRLTFLRIFINVPFFISLWFGIITDRFFSILCIKILLPFWWSTIKPRRLRALIKSYPENVLLIKQVLPRKSCIEEKSRYYLIFLILPNSKE